MLILLQIISPTAAVVVLQQLVVVPSGGLA